MKKPLNLHVILSIAFVCFNSVLIAQHKTTNPAEETKLRSVKPFKVLTNGRQITIQAKQNIRMVMVWTASGHRIVEAKEINTSIYSFTITVKEKIFFMMIETADRKIFTEKIGIQ
jgi:hypothetical protein